MIFGGTMIFLDALPEVKQYIDDVNKEFMRFNKSRSNMSNIAMRYLSYCLTALITVGKLNWDSFEKASCGTWKAKALSWMLHHSTKIPWEVILVASSKFLIKTFNICKCHLVFDDFDRERSKRTKKIFGTHKVRNKKGGGFISSQNIVLLILVTPVVTIPLFFYFYRPDPVQKAWRKEDERLRKLGIPKKLRPKQPALDKDFPNKQQIAAKLLRKVKYYFPELNILSISGDALYLSSYMKAEVSRIYPQTQFISQLRRNQSVMLSKNRKCQLEKYFERLKEIKKVIKLRGHLERTVYYKSARLFIKSHSKVSHVVAYRYEGETRWRYICASNLTWRSQDIIQAFSYRWLVEVVIEDLKQYDGWGKDASQYGINGARRGLLLSLLLDQFLTQHPSQVRLYQRSQSLHTAGSLRYQLQFEILFQSIGKIVESDDPKAKLKEISESINQLVTLRPSTKHMSGQHFEELEPSPSLLKKFGRRAA